METARLGKTQTGLFLVLQLSSFSPVAASEKTRFHPIEAHKREDAVSCTRAILGGWLKTSRKLFRLGGFDVGHLHIEVEGLSRQRVVEVDHDSLLFDFMDAHGDGLSLRAFRHEHGADLLSVLRNLVFRNLLKGPCRTTFGALQRTGYCWVLMLSAGALELLLGIRPFIE